jgi:hypothetical protein
MITYKPFIKDWLYIDLSKLQYIPKEFTGLFMLPFTWRQVLYNGRHPTKDSDRANEGHAFEGQGSILEDWYRL